MIVQHHGGLDRPACPDPTCGYIHWDNPVPVVAAIVEHEGDIILARNVAWPGNFFALITGFLEKDDPSPESGARREVKEELNLDAQTVSFVGHYPFERMNQLIIAFHVVASGEIKLNEELADYRRVAPAKARYWPAATGLALRDWLLSCGHKPEQISLG
jgi:NADH pyrophosphatase NudC (nudix superfamily)